MMETMIPPQVGMRLRTLREKKEKKKKKWGKRKKEKEKTKEKQKQKIIINKERRGIASILYHTCASK